MCYRHFLTYFSSKGYPSYSLSFRGHGNSFNPGYWALYFTGLRTFVQEAALAINHITSLHSTAPVVMGHSSGGGVIQYVVSYDVATVSGVALLGAVSGFGSLTTYLKWWTMDPWFYPRYIKDGCHPRSALSSTDLVRQTFFVDDAPEEVVIECEKYMPEYESMSWPMEMMWEFAQPELLAKRVAKMEKGMLFLAAENDRLVTPKISHQLATWYRSAAEFEGVSPRFEEKLLEHSGHHLMTDVSWENGARLVWEWLEGKSEGV